MNTIDAPLTQQYAAYTPDDHRIWQLLFSRQMDILPNRASQIYLDGISAAGFEPHRIPHFEQDVTPKIKALTGWSIGIVPGLIEPYEFFTLLADRIFPASTWLRTEAQMDYLEEPDMFHDTFGHIPLLTNISFCDFLAKFSAISLRFLDHPTCLEYIRRLYWFTVEFGLIREDGQLKIYGGGILSSPGESLYSLASEEPIRVDFDVAEIFDTFVKIDEYQQKYFIIDSYEQLVDALPEFERLLEKTYQASH
jgi:phenylalanine-4-hydroxylase